MAELRRAGDALVTAPVGFDDPEAYISRDRRRALALGIEPLDRVRGAALFADISASRRGRKRSRPSSGPSAARRS